MSSSFLSGLRHFGFSAVLAATFAITPVIAQPTPDVTVGERVPALAAQDQFSQEQTLRTLSGERGLVLAFVRSIDWCPYCKDQVVDLNNAREEFYEAGYNVAALSYDPVADALAFTEARDIEIPILSDPRSALINAFGLLNTDYAMGTRFYGVPHPAIYIISKDGVVESYFAEADYKNRPDLSTVIHSLVLDVAPDAEMDGDVELDPGEVETTIIEENVVTSPQLDPVDSVEAVPAETVEDLPPITAPAPVPTPTVAVPEMTPVDGNNDMEPQDLEDGDFKAVDPDGDMVLEYDKSGE